MDWSSYSGSLAAGFTLILGQWIIKQCKNSANWSTSTKDTLKALTFAMVLVMASAGLQVGAQALSEIVPLSPTEECENEVMRKVVRNFPRLLFNLREKAEIRKVVEAHCAEEFGGAKR